MAKEVCTPSPPHGGGHVDWQHFKDGKYVGRCPGGEHDSTPHIVEGAQRWHDSGRPGHPSGRGRGASDREINNLWW